MVANSRLLYNTKHNCAVCVCVCVCLYVCVYVFVCVSVCQLGGCFDDFGLFLFFYSSFFLVPVCLSPWRLLRWFWVVSWFSRPFLPCPLPWIPPVIFPVSFYIVFRFLSHIYFFVLFSLSHSKSFSHDFCLQQLLYFCLSCNFFFGFHSLFFMSFALISSCIHYIYINIQRERERES